MNLRWCLGGVELSTLDPERGFDQEFLRTPTWKKRGQGRKLNGGQRKGILKGQYGNQ